ncbi:tetratricopeptide repeat protein [Lujinxingia vulgaris]|uniref:Tetratricopeptide repeat protein n=1 Tax=Lujinxingia vulgaris TaxID=2600176 RepID=A0A5C6XB69_9DELT|nr:tetratricopeptide repeat protein [Lujinxingia vulgaris]TXD34578.1 tetratricopeptide repeat protein [Lujinxingia vulgaris]
MNRENQVQEYVAQLEANPYDLAPVGRLEEAFGSTEELAELVAIFEQRAQGSASRDAAARLYLEAARMAGGRLNDLERSVELLGHSLTVGEDTLVSVEAYLFQLALQDDADQLQTFFAEALEHDTDGGYQSRLYQRMGSILEDFVGDLEQADTAYKWALDLDPNNVIALWSRQVLARKQAAWEKLATLMIEEIEQTADPLRQSALSLTVGEIYRDYLDSADSARQCFAFAWEQDPTNTEALQAAVALGFEPEGVEIDALEEISAVEEVEEEAAPMTMELDDSLMLEEIEPEPVSEELPELPVEAAEAAPMTMELDESLMLEEVEAEPVGDNLPDLPVEVLEAEDEALEAADEVEELEALESADVEEGEEIEAAGDVDDADEVVEEMEALDASDEDEQALEVADEVDELEALDEAEELDEAEALEASEDDEAAELDAADASEDVEELDELEELDAADEVEVVADEAPAASRDWRDRFASMVERAEAAGGEEGLRLLVRAARLQARHTTDADEGVALFERALATGQGLEYYKRISYLYADNAFWQGALDAVESSEVEGGGALRARIALYELSDVEMARTIAEDVNDEAVLDALSDLEEAQANWRKFQRSLEQRHADLDAEERALKVYLRMADLAAALNEPDKEIDALRRLERQVDAEQVKSRLKILYKRAAKWPMYVDLVKQEVEALEEDRVEDKVDLLYEVIRVYREEMNQDRMAINIYKEILGLAPEDLDAIDQLIDLYGDMNMSSDLINMLQTKAEIVPTAEQKVAIYSQIATLFIEKFRNQAEAIKAYEQVLEIEPYNSDAITFLKEMYEKRRDWESLIDVSKREIETFDSDEARAEGLKEVARLATDKLRKPEVATELWLEVRAFAPADADALDALETLYEKNRDYEALAEILEQKVAQSEDAAESMKLYQKLGMLYADRLEDSQRATEAWKGALALDPEDLKARKALERLYIDNRQWDELEAFYAESDAYSDLVRILGTLSGTIKEDDVKIELLLRSARIWREELDDTNRAERELERVLQLDAENEAAAAQLAPIYEEAGDAGKLKSALEIVLSHREEPSERKALQLQLARLHRDSLDDVEGAFSRFSQAYLEVPSELDVVAELEATAGEAGEWSTLVEHYRQALDADLDEAQTLEVRALLGRVLSEELGDLDAALEQFQAVLDVEEDNLRALEAMERIYFASARWDDLMQVYRHRLELEDDRDARVQILQGMARIAEVEASDVVTAIARHNEALELDPHNFTSLAELHRLYAQEDEYADLADVIRKEIDLVERRARLKSRRYATNLVDIEALIGEGAPQERSMFGEGFAGGDDVEDVLADLSDDSVAQEIAAESGDEDSAAEAVEAAQEEAIEGIEDLDTIDLGAPAYYTEEDVEFLSALRFELGLVCMDHLGEVEEAVAALAKVVLWRPDHAEACQALERLLDDELFKAGVATILEPVYEVHGRWEDLVSSLSIQAEAADEPEAARELERRAGDVLLNELGEGARAFERYARVIASDPADASAREQLYRIAHELELWDELVVACEAVLPEIEDDALRVDYFFVLATVNAERREAYDDARRNLEEVLLIDAGSARALDDLEELFITTEAWRDLLEVFDRKIEQAEEAAEAEALKFRKAQVWENLLEDAHQAIAIYLEILDDAPENLRAYAELDRIYEAEAMWNELATNLEAELELVDEEAQLPIKNRLAALVEAQLGDASRAVDLYEEVLDADADNMAANAAMEVLMMQEGAPRARISKILEPIYIARGDAARQVAALEVQVEVSQDPDERVALLHRIAALHEGELQDIASAFVTYARALRDDVANEATLDNLYRIGEATQSFEELVQVFEQEAEYQTDPDVKRDMMRRAAAIYIEPLAELDRATVHLHAVLELFPADLETVEELETIYRHTQEWSELVQILVTKSELVEDLDERKDLLHQAGTLFEDILSGPDEAVEVYHRALAIDEADRHAIDRLEVLYTEMERWHDLLEIYQRKLDLADDDAARKDLLYVMGAIYQEHLQQPDDAIDTYRRVLDLDASEKNALEKLDELFEATEQWHELLETLEQQLQLSPYAEEIETLKYRSGRLWEVQLGDALRAVEVYQDVLSQNPQHQPSIEALEGLVERNEQSVEAAQVLQPLYQDAGQWEKLVWVYRLLIDATEDPDRRIELYKEVGPIVEERMGDKAEAFTTYVEALNVDAGRVEIVDTLERLAGELGAWDVFIEQIDQRLVSVTDFEVATALHLRVARIFEEELDQPQQAITRFTRVLEIEPEQTDAILALDRLYQREGEWANLAEILRTRIFSSEEPAEAMELRLRLGLLYQAALDDAENAISTYQEVLLEEPDNAQAIDNLEQMFMEGRQVQRISDILEPYYLEKGQHEKLVEIYLQRLEMLDDPIERYELLTQVARIFLDPLQDFGRAMQAYGAALVERPDDEMAIAELDRLAEQTLDWGAAASFYADALESPQITDDAALDLWLRVATILDARLEQFEDAEMAYLKVLELDPTHAEALAALDRIYLAQARWADLAGVLERRVEGTYDELEVVELNFRLAQVFAEQLTDYDQAVSTYERILSIQPDHEQALANLEQIHTALQSWEPLFDVLERRSQLTHDPDEQADYQARMARIAEDMLGRTDDAVDLWERASELRPDDRMALGELRRLYLDGERWDDLVGVLRREVELSQDPDEQLNLYESLGTIYGEYLNDEIQAQDAWTAVLGLDARHLPALEALRDIATRQADYQQQADMVERLIAHEQVAHERKLDLWVELGRVQGDMLMNPEAAIDAWKNVLGLDPGHEQALDELEGLYLQESRWEEAAQVLELKADRMQDAEQQIELLTRVAEIWETKLLDRDQAVQFHRAVLEIDPMRMSASRALEAIFVEQGTAEGFEQLAGVYLDRAEMVGDDIFERVENLRNAARIFEENLMQPENALVVLLSAFGPETMSDEALIADIERLARQTGLWEEAVSRFGDVLRAIDDSPEAAELHRLVGQWRATELNQPDEAVYHLQRALAINPDSVEILEMLEGLYRRLAAWPELAQVLRTQVDLVSEPDSRVELWRKLGELSEMQLGEVDQAVEAYREILVIDPTDILAMESLERVFETFERWEELVAVLEQKAGATYDPDAIVAIKSRAAELWEVQLGDIGQAIMAYRDVLTVDQTHAPTLEALERLYTQSGQWDELVDVLEQRLALTHEPDAQVAIYGKMAGVFEGQFGDMERAVESYNNILMVDVENVTAIENLERLYHALERWFELVDVLQRHIELSQRGEEKVALYTELGRVQRDQVRDPHSAIEAFNAALGLEPINPQLWSELAQLHESTSNWESAVEAYNRLADQLEDPAERVDVYFRAGQLMESQLHDHANAEDAYLSALRLEPTHPGVLDAVRNLLAIQQEWQSLIRVLKAAEEATRDLSAKAALQCEIGKVYEEQVGDEVSALRYYESALELEPRITEAAEPLIDVYVRERRFERAIPLLEMVIGVFSQGSAPASELHRRQLQLAQAYDQLAQPERALVAYRNAYELDPNDMETLKGLGQLLYAREEWEQASKVLQALQLHHADKLETPELAEIYFRLGSVRKTLGEMRKASQYFEKTLELSPQHRPTLVNLVEVSEAQSKWEDVVHYTRWLLDAESDPTARFAHLSKMGDLLATKLNQPPAAVDAYEQALALEPKSVVILRKLLDLYTKTRQWHEAVDILKRIIEQEQDPGRIAKYYYTAAVIYRDEIDDPMQAVALFDETLDVDVKMLKAFEAIDRILTKQKEWKELSRAYRRMLHRVSEHDDGQMESVKTLLWQNLGEIYRTRLGDMETAIEAYKIAVGLNPSDEKLRLILAELYEKTGSDPEGAIEQHRALIELDQFRVESYRVLFKSYIQTKQYDKAWCMAGALSFLQSASEQEETFYRKYLGAHMQPARGTFNEEMYKRLYHPRQDVLITYIMTVLGQGLRPMYSLASIKDWGVHKKRDLVDLEEQTPFNNVYRYVAQTMQLLPAPRVYLKGDQAMGMRNANVDPAAVIIGGDVRQKSGDRELAFIIAKSLTWVMPRHYVGSIGQPTEFLKLLFMALMDITDPSLGIGATLGEQGAPIKEELMALPGPMLMQAQKAMKQFLSKGQNPNLSEWVLAVEHTAIRMGLLICGDLHTAAGCIKSDLVPMGKASVKEKIRELVLFSISEEYFQLREELGLAIGK